MIDLSLDGSQVYPDSELKRGSLAVALGALLIKDPGLNMMSLEGTIKEIKGNVQLTRSGKSIPLKDDTKVYVGDTLISQAGGTAKLTYSDGSKVLIDENTEINIKEAVGREYIKLDGSVITADYLTLEMKKGIIFGAIATNQSSQLKVPDQKIKMKVDMPCGFVAVRGTFFKVVVDSDESAMVSCLEGKVELGGHDGNTQVLAGNQSCGIEISGKTGQPAGMNVKDKQDFSRVQEFIVQSALQIALQNETEVVDTLKLVLDALKASGIGLKSEVIENLKEQLQKIHLDLDLKTYEQSSSSSSNSSSNNNNQPVLKTIDIVDIPGVTPPKIGGTPVTLIETEQYTGTVTWNPSDNLFLSKQTYNATINLQVKNGYTFSGVRENFFIVKGAVATNTTNSGIVMAEFPATLSNDATVITKDTCYNVNTTACAITADQTVLNTNTTVEQFLANLTKDDQASWKVVTSGAAITSQNKFDATTGKASLDTLLFGNRLAVKAGDGTMKVYEILAALVDPIVITVTSDKVPKAPSGWKKSHSSADGKYYGMVCGDYVYWLYDDIDNGYNLKILAYNRLTGECDKSWDKPNSIRYIQGISFDLDKVIFTGQEQVPGQGGRTLEMTRTELSIP